MKSIGVGLAGLGTVGAALFDALQRQHALLAQRSGSRFEIRSVVVRDLNKSRDVAVPHALLTTSWRDLPNDPEIKIVVELLGGTTDAFELVKSAIESGRIVVTANKALLAEHGREIFALAKEYDVPIFFEAAVAGGIPIIQSLRDAFVGNRIESIEAILNGTSNYILSRMQEGGLDYGAALAEAQELGYAEANPAIDINGGDAAHKATILAALAYGFWIEPQGRRVAGIEQVRAADAIFAKHLGYVIKLLATVRATADDAIEVTVAPTLISEKSLLASVGGAFNAIAVKGDLVGEALFYGQGAGGKATASSVIGDLVEAALMLESSRRHIGFTPHSLYSKSHPPAEIRSCYYLRLSVEDRPGVLGTVARILGEEGVGIASVIQPKSTDGQETSLVFMTHEAPYGTIATALEKIALLPCVTSRPVLFNVHGSTGGLT